MIGLLAALFAAALPLWFGALLLRIAGLRWRDERIGYSAWAYLIGSLVVAAAMQIAVLLGVAPWHAQLAAALGVAALALRRSSAPWCSSPAPCGRGFAAFVLLGVLLALLFAAAGMDRPCIEGDEGNIWSLKAKSLLVDWGPGFATAQVHNLHPDYPQLNPLLQAWVYACTGSPEFVQFENRWPIQLCDVALFVAVAAALRRRLPAWLAAPLAALVLLEPEFLQLCRNAYADGMVALGLVVALDAGLRWRDGGDRRWLWLSMAGLTFAIWSKNETMLYLAAFGGAWLLVRLLHGPGKRPRGGDWLPVLLVPAAVLHNVAWNKLLGLQSDLMGANPTGKSMFVLMAEQWRERVPALLREFGALCVDLGHAHAVFALLALAVLLGWRRLRAAHALVPTLALLIALDGLHVVYVGSFLPLRFHLDTSYTRVLFQLLPAAVLLIAVLLSAVVAERPAGQTARRP